MTGTPSKILLIRAPISSPSILYRISAQFRSLQSKGSVCMYNNAIPTMSDHSNVIPQVPMSYGYAFPVQGHCGNVRGCESFIIIIVLFILLIIIGAIAFCL